MRKLSSIITVVILIISLLAGCVRDSSDETGNVPGTGSGNISSLPGGSNDLPEAVYLSEIIQFPALPDGITEINNVALSNERVYFAAWGEAAENARLNESGLFSMDIDGTSLTALPNYSPHSLPEIVTRGSVHISALHVDHEENIWIAEYYASNDSGEAETIGSVLRKLDKTGAEISSFDLDDLAVGNELVYVNALSVDDAGNIYIASIYSIFIIDDQRNLLFSLENNDYISNLILLSDGTVAFISLSDGNIFLKKIDTGNRAWGEIIRMPSNVPQTHSVFSGTEEYEYLFNDNTYLNGVAEENNELVRLLSWIDSSLTPEEINGIMLMPDGRIAATRQRHSATGLPVIELLLLTETAIEDIPDKTGLTLATFNYNYNRFLRAAVERFNSRSDTHQIKVTDYSVFNTDENSNAGLLRLNTEIITGNSPDILDLGSLPQRSYISKGLLIDLYPFLDADPELGRDSIIENVLRLTDVDGALYQIFPGFGINTMYGNPSVLGSYPGWTLDEFLEVLDANPQADFPLGSWMNKIYFLENAFRYNTDRFIDPKTSTALFDSNDFIGLLEIANRFPAESDLNYSEPMYKLIANNRQIIGAYSIYQFENFPTGRSMYGGEIVFKGFPNENRNGNVLVPYTNLAISAYCTDPGAAWEFLRILLTEDYQRENLFMLFPSSKTVFDEKLDYNVNSSGGISTGDGYTTTVSFSQEDADVLIGLINNLNRIMEYDPTIWMIVSESAQDYFNGRITVHDAARIIQNRVSIYLAEQAG